MARKLPEATITLNGLRDLQHLKRLFKKFKETGEGGDALVLGYKHIRTNRTPTYNNNSRFSPATNGRYLVGRVYKEPKADTSNASCAEGINVATRAWVLHDEGSGYILWGGRRGILLSFFVRDIASIPPEGFGSTTLSGKLRVRRAKVECDLPQNCRLPK